MWNYIRALGIDTYRTLVQLVKEHMELESLSQAGKFTIKIYFSRSAYMSEIYTRNALHVTLSNEVELPEKKGIYIYAKIVSH